MRKHVPADKKRFVNSASACKSPAANPATYISSRSTDGHQCSLSIRAGQGTEPSLFHESNFTTSRRTISGGGKTGASTSILG